MKRKLVLIIVVIFAALLSSCIAEQTEDVPVSESAKPVYPSSTSFIESETKRITDYYTCNHVALEEFALAFIDAGCYYAHFDENGAEITLTNTAEIKYYGWSDLPGDLSLFAVLPYIKLDGIVHDTIGCLIENSNIIPVSFMSPYERVSEEQWEYDCRISAWLCFEEGLSEQVLGSNVIKLSSDWIIYFHYDEDSLYYEQFDL